MRKQIVGEPTQAQAAQSGIKWLNLEEIASVELTSEDPSRPFELALDGGRDHGWRAAAPGVQTIRLRFDEPQRIQRIRLRFEERERERQQEFVLRYWTASAAPTDKAIEIVRQQWGFSPGGSTEEVEEYAVDLRDVISVELEIDADRGRHTLPATLLELMMA